MSLKKLIIVCGVLAMIASFAYIAGCLSTVPTVNSGNATMNTTPIKVNVVVQQPVKATEQPPKYYSTATPTPQKQITNLPYRGTQDDSIRSHVENIPKVYNTPNPTPRPTL